MVTTKTIAVIPARGGSKRIPKKNIVDFFRKPMIAWTIEAAIRSNCFSKVIVSTDCEEIANVSLSYGAEVPFLRKEFYCDHSSVSEATIHCIDQLEAYLGEKINYVVQLMANCPLRNAVDIKQFVSSFHKEQMNFQISCFKFGWMNPWWAHSLNENNVPSSLFPSALKKDPKI